MAAINLVISGPMSLRKLQQTTGTYPRPSTTCLWNPWKSFHIFFKGYVPGVCWNFLRMRIFGFFGGFPWFGGIPFLGDLVEKIGFWLFRVNRGMNNYTAIYRDYFISHLIRIPIKPTSISWFMSCQGFDPCSGDLIEKVQWARANDDLSRAIVSWLMGSEEVRLLLKRDTRKMYTLDDSKMICFFLYIWFFQHDIINILCMHPSC